jgi:hypothetical protein
MNTKPTQSTEQKALVERSPGGPKTKTGQGTRQSTDKLTTKMILKKKQFATDKEP